MLKKFKNISKSKKILLISGISLLVGLLIFFVVFAFTDIFSENYEDAEITQEQTVPVDKATGKINFLLLGVDVDGLRTDTIMLASYDLDNNKVNVLSIPRDTRMYIGNKYQKINAAHAVTQNGKIKGPQGSIEAVTRLTGIPINYYVEFSFATFRNTIDALGGVYYDVPQDMFYEDPVQDLYINLKKGYQLLDGDKSEQLVRYRRYPEGDIARVRVQQDFLSKVFEQKLNSTIITKIPDLYKQLSNDINTNIGLIDIMKIVPNLGDLTTENITMHQLPGGYSGDEYSASYWICDITKTKELIKNTFGYDASKATIHSADGKSIQKDVKITKTPSPTTKPEITAKPTIEPTAKPTNSSAPISSASPSTASPPNTSANPQSTPNSNEVFAPNSTPSNDDDEPKSSKNPATTQPTKNPTNVDSVETDNKTPAPTKPAETDSPVVVDLITIY